jgi:23S rRNA pseudouridine1911/1915/1917 synthase
VRVWVDRPGSARRRTGTYILAEAGRAGKSGKAGKAGRAGEKRLSILYEDDDLIVVNKPPGLLAVPLPDKRDASSVLDILSDHLRSHRTRQPFVIHRIDRDTSGLVVVAKHQKAQVALKSQFRRREPERVYLAVVYGRPDPPSGTWRDRLVWDSRASIQKETHPDDPRGVEAVSHYTVKETFADASLVEVRLVTGKRNQIRLQARLRGHTLVGETRYIFGPDALRSIEFPRQALHAFRLAFRHPSTGDRVAFEAPQPEDMTQLLARLRAPRPKP